MKDAPKQLTAAELQELARSAVPCQGLALTPDGQAVVIGRHPLALGDVVIRVDPVDLAEFVHAMMLQLLDALRRTTHDGGGLRS